MFSSRRIRHLWLVQFLADFLAIVVSYYLTVYLRFFSSFGRNLFDTVVEVLDLTRIPIEGMSLSHFYLLSAPRIVLLVTFVLTFFYALYDLYPGRRFIRPRALAWRIIVANLTALFLFFTYLYLQRNVYHPRSFFLVLCMLNILFCIGFRTAIARGLDYLRERHGFDRWRALVVGATDEARQLADYLIRVQPHGIRAAEQLAPDPGEPFEQIARRIQARHAGVPFDLLIVADPRFTVSQLMQFLETAQSLDIATKILTGKFDVLVNQAHLPADFVAGTPLVHFERPSTGERYGRLVQPAARALATLGLVVCAPLLALLALLVRLSGPGPVLFVQERIGVNRRPFRMWKFRTMHDRAEELRAQLEEFNESGTGLFKMRSDPRVTPVGRFLRRFSLDELPQLYNVLRGEMALVGPRPLPRDDFRNYYEDWHYSRHEGMPGLTCLWQVSGRSEIDFHNMCILDLFYLRNRSWVLDLKILLRTVGIVIFAKGAY